MDGIEGIVESSNLCWSVNIIAIVHVVWMASTEEHSFNIEPCRKMKTIFVSQIPEIDWIKAVNKTHWIIISFFVWIRSPIWLFTHRTLFNYGYTNKSFFFSEISNLLEHKCAWITRYIDRWVYSMTIYSFKMEIFLGKYILSSNINIYLLQKNKNKTCLVTEMVILFALSLEDGYSGLQHLFKPNTKICFCFFSATL